MTLSLFTPVTTTVCVVDELPVYKLLPIKTAVTFVEPVRNSLRSVAVPLLVTHTVPSTAESSQCGALALQKLTFPPESGVPPEVTVAVIVITDPAAALAGETASVVVVLLAAKAGRHEARSIPHSNVRTENRNRLAIVL